MGPVALLLIVSGGLLLRQVVMGRVMETPGDLRELFQTALTGDFDGAWSVLSSRGTADDTVTISSGGTDSDTGSVSGTPGSGGPSNSEVLNTARGLGRAASGYTMGATGPTRYDCSGLVWKTLVQMGAYKGSRFTTATFDNVAPKFADKVSDPQVGDIANDRRARHMGIVSGPDMFYSAMNPSSGIGDAKISSFKGAGGQAFTPTYWRVRK